MRTLVLMVIFTFFFCALISFVACQSDDSDSDDDGPEGGEDYGIPDTWKDNSTGLTWQVRQIGTVTWAEAGPFCEKLALAGGGWRLPTISELRSILKGCASTQTGGSCGVTDSCISEIECKDSTCEGCDGDEGPYEGCYFNLILQKASNCDIFWSSTAMEELPNDHWYIDFYFAKTDRPIFQDVSYWVRCVR